MSEIDFEEINTDELIALGEFIKHFNIHYKLLLRRYARFREINDVYNNDIDVITYLDMIVVQLRAMCIESPNLKKNYTAQILLRKLGEEVLAEKLDTMLNKEFIPGATNLTIRKALKILADGFICHYDNFDGLNNETWGISAIIESRLRNPYDSHNLDYIMKTVIDCVGEGLILKKK